MADESLKDFISNVAGDTYLRVEQNLGDGFVRLRTAEAERRQAKHDIRFVEDIVIEMLRNARDAGANTIYLATSRDGDTRTLTFIDNGSGIPDAMRDLIFEPRVTSKLETMVMDRWGVHGRGMALFSIRSNAQSAQVVASGVGMGSAFVIEVDLDDLPERADQSTVPVLLKGEDGTEYVSHGPHNVIRQVLEFALEDRGIDVYLGTPTEILATLVSVGHRQNEANDLLFCDDPATLPICTRPAAAADAPELSTLAASIGIPVSERTAHRILAGGIRPLRPAITRVVAQKPVDADPMVDIYRDRRGLRVSKEDMESFARGMECAFQPLADAYYLNLTGLPKITVSGNSIRVRFDIDKTT